jgi:hypothetical protein
MSYRFITDSLKADINDNVINEMFPKLNMTHRDILLKYLIITIDVLAEVYNFSGDSYVHQIKQNNYQDVKWLLMFLLPYLNKEPSEIGNLNDIYTSKLKNVDINKIAPKYTYSNLQYGRCIRGETAKEIQFNEEHVKHNFYLLIDTIKTSSHKLYVNWMDVLPYTRKNIEKSPLYKVTNAKYNSKILNDWNPIEIPENRDDSNYAAMLQKMGGISVGDIYNVARMYLYDDIQRIKWLIYDVVLTAYVPVPGLCMLNDTFTIDGKSLISYMLLDVKWGELTNREQSQFEVKWKDLLNHAMNNLDYEIVGFTVKSYSVERFVKSIIQVFNNHYAKNNKKVALSGYKAIVKKTKEDTVDDDDDEGGNLVFSDIIDTIESIKPMFLYDFIRRDVQRFKYTYYGTNMLTDDKTALKTEYSFMSDMLENASDKDIKITQKNFYNFCKSLVSFIDVNEPDKNKQFKQFPRNWKMLEDDQKTEILKRLNDGYPDNDWFHIGRYLQYLKLSLGEDSKDSAEIKKLNSVIYNGIRKIFIKIVFDAMVTKGTISRYIPNKRITDGAYISRDKVQTILKDTVFSKSNDYWSNSYYYLTELPYSMTGDFMDKDMLTNIFKYNSREAWYAAYALDWISQLGFCHHFIHNRVSYITGATGVGKSTQVPKLFLYYTKAIEYNSMGRVVCTQPRKTPTSKNAAIVSLEMGVPIYDDNGETDKYYVQMKHRGKSHVKKTDHLSLKYITDGSLIQELRDPLLKEKSGGGAYTTTNLYDVIIIDEAHEHNKYMDLLLTMLRDPTYYNNSIKLVILSATMDEDEPVYRRYYRDINDNKKYPLDCWLRNSKLDRINVDRRFHISPPGKATRYKITDIYEPDSDSISVVSKILKSGMDGDILLFQPGRKEIDETVASLNSILPGNVIALPYHSQLKDSKRDYIEKIDKNITKLRIDKLADFDTVEDLEKGSGFYNHFILVATNIAEASITIATLKYIIDTGTQKTNIYNYVRRGDLLSKTHISESSRLQRRGRVGRRGSGTAYYLYEEGTMANNKTMYNISIENISDDIFSRLCNKHTELKFFQTDPTMSTSTGLSDALRSIFTSLYNTSAGFFNYIGVPEHYDYENKQSPTDIMETGYPHHVLTDNTGVFYIVHPDELYINRDIMGRIVGSIKKDVVFKRIPGKLFGEIESKKIESFWEDYKQMNFLTTDFDKTEFGTFMIDTLESLQFDRLTFGRMFIYSELFNVSSSMAKILSMIMTTDGDIKKILLQDSYYRYNITDVKSSLGSVSGDIEAFYILANDLLNYLQARTETFSIENIIGRLSEKFKLSKRTIEDIIYKYETDDPDIEDDIDREKILSHAFDNVMINDDTKEIINDWSIKHGVNSKSMINFTREYLNMNDKISKIYHPTSSSKDYSAYIKTQKTKYISMIDGDVDPIKLSFCLAVPFNIGKSITSTGKYMNIYSPTLDNIYSIQSLAKKRYIPATFTSSIYTSNYIYYVGVNVELGTIYCLSYIPIKYLKYLGNIFSPERIDRISSIGDMEKIREFINTRLDKIVPSDYKILVNVKRSYDELLDDLKSVLK